MALLDPNKPLATCVAETCDNCPVHGTLHSHFRAGDLVHFARNALMMWAKRLWPLMAFSRGGDRIAGLLVAGREDLVNFQPAWAPQFDNRYGEGIDHPLYVLARSKEQVI